MFFARMDLFKTFDRVSIVNLPHRHDRRVETVAELRLLQQEVDGKHIQFFPAIRPESRGEFPTIGARGCFMSHHAIIKQAVADGVERLLILEDDVTFSPDFARSASALAEALVSRDWDIAYLGHSLPPAGGADLLRAVNDSILCAHCYALSRRGMQSLLAYLDVVVTRPDGHPEGGAQHYDGALNMWRAKFGAVCRVTDPSFVGQRSSRTDIHALGLKDRLPLVRQALATARSLKNLVLRYAKRRQLL